jgi:hypothetical protein
MKCEKGNEIIVPDWCEKCHKNNLYKRYCDVINDDLKDENKSCTFRYDDSWK